LQFFGVVVIVVVVGVAVGVGEFVSWSLPVFRCYSPSITASELHSSLPHHSLFTVPREPRLASFAVAGFCSGVVGSLGAVEHHEVEVRSIEICSCFVGPVVSVEWT